MMVGLPPLGVTVGGALLAFASGFVPARGHQRRRCGDAEQSHV